MFVVRAEPFLGLDLHADLLFRTARFDGTKHDGVSDLDIPYGVLRNWCSKCNLILGTRASSLIDLYSSSRMEHRKE